jgi:hypothetical protein
MMPRGLPRGASLKTGILIHSVMKSMEPEDMPDENDKLPADRKGVIFKT